MRVVPLGGGSLTLHTVKKEGLLWRYLSGCPVVFASDLKFGVGFSASRTRFQRKDYSLRQKKIILKFKFYPKNKSSHTI